MIMAEVNGNVNTSEDEQTSCVNIQPTQICANCSLIEQQLQSALIELKSAQAVIALLSDDIKHYNLWYTLTWTINGFNHGESRQPKVENSYMRQQSYQKHSSPATREREKLIRYFKPLYTPI